MPKSGAGSEIVPEAEANQSTCALRLIAGRYLEK